MRAILLTVCAVLFSGCSLFMHSIERPSAKVRDVSVSAAGLGGVTGELRLDVTNPNGFGVPLAGIDWQLAIGGARAVTGKVELSQTIPAKGVAPVTTALTVQARDAVEVASRLAGGARTYHLSATLRFSTPVGELSVNVEHDGSLGGLGSILGAR